jgi:hypothetical protein
MAKLPITIRPPSLAPSPERDRAISCRVVAHTPAPSRHQTAADHGFDLAATCTARDTYHIRRHLPSFANEFPSLPSMTALSKNSSPSSHPSYNSPAAIATVQDIFPLKLKCIYSALSGPSRLLAISAKCIRRPTSYNDKLLTYSLPATPYIAQIAQFTHHAHYFHHDLITHIAHIAQIAHKQYYVDETLCIAIHACSHTHSLLYLHCSHSSDCSSRSLRSSRPNHSHSSHSSHSP